MFETKKENRRVLVIDRFVPAYDTNSGALRMFTILNILNELGYLVTLIPDDTGGVFEIRIDGRLLWSRGERGRFPEIKELKQMVRDEVAPSRDLGHVDKKDETP
jgi:selT/selW/selH-like putative selenoprotein